MKALKSFLYGLFWLYRLPWVVMLAALYAVVWIVAAPLLMISAFAGWLRDRKTTHAPTRGKL